MYINVLSRVPQEWTWISTTPEGSSIPTPNQTGRDMGVAFLFIETRAWTWIPTTHTSLFFPRHTKTSCAQGQW